MRDKGASTSAVPLSLLIYISPSIRPVTGTPGGAYWGKLPVGSAAHRGSSPGPSRRSHTVWAALWGRCAGYSSCSKPVSAGWGGVFHGTFLSYPRREDLSTVLH